MPLQATSGAASYDAFGGGVAAVPNYIEECFSTFLYQGNGSTQTITNGIDLSGKGGMVWLKRRDASGNNWVGDTVRGRSKLLITNSTGAEQTSTTGNDIASFNADGFTLGPEWVAPINTNAATYASWTFREQPKFFDVVTYTGNDTSQNIAHNLGSVPGCIIIKSTTSAVTWRVYHRSLATGLGAVRLNSDSAAVSSSSFWNSTVPTSTQFTVGSDNSVNAIGQTYVAYIFAHNAGGFGLTGTDNVISCGMATMPAGGGPVTVNLGWEPQWVLMKDINHTGGCQWFIQDNIRGWPAESTSAPDYKYLQAHLSSAEGTSSTNQGITSTGFSINRGFNYADGNTNIIYIAIRRGPMKVPTTGTSVFSPIKAYNATGTKNTTDFPVDLQIAKNFVDGGQNNVNDRLRGVSSVSTEANPSGPVLYTDATSAEVSAYRTFQWDNTGYNTPVQYSNYDFIYWNFRRAPGFFDEVCYTGTGSARTVNHNLGVAPELVIIKMRSNTGFADQWVVGSSALPSWGRYLGLNTTDAVNGSNNAGPFNNTAPTVSVFSVGTWRETNGSGGNLVAYLFASCPGVSKVTNFTGTGALQTINCGFTSGARFVLIKRTDSTGDWYVWDSSRGLSSSNDPYLLLNSTAAEVTTTNWVDTTATGFQVTAAAGNNVNINGASYIALAIA